MDVIFNKRYNTLCVCVRKNNYPDFYILGHKD